MSSILVDLLGTEIWLIIFSTAFFFSFIYFLLLIFGAIGHHNDDLHHDDWHVDTDHDLHLDADHHIDLHTDHDLHIDTSHELHFDTDHDLHGFEHLELDKTVYLDKTDKSMEFRSHYKMGNISSFLFFFGLVGISYNQILQDLHIGIALASGIIGLKVFSYIIANYTKTVIVPIHEISRGDIAEVILSVEPDKAGRVHVLRKDGVVSLVMAKGAYPHDYFAKGEKGYIWGKSNEIYLITKGIEGQPDLNEEETKSKKAMDYDLLE